MLVYLEKEIIHFILNDQIITEAELIRRIEMLIEILKKNKPSRINLLIHAFQTEYDSEKTHATMPVLFNKMLTEFNNIPRRTAIYNHYRTDTKFDFVRFFTNEKEAADWLAG